MDESLETRMERAGENLKRVTESAAGLKWIVQPLEQRLKSAVVIRFPVERTRAPR